MIAMETCRALGLASSPSVRPTEAEQPATPDHRKRVPKLSPDKDTVCLPRTVQIASTSLATPVPQPSCHPAI